MDRPFCPLTYLTQLGSDAGLVFGLLKHVDDVSEYNELMATHVPASEPISAEDLKTLEAFRMLMMGMIVHLGEEARRLEEFANRDEAANRARN